MEKVCGVEWRINMRVRQVGPTRGDVIEFKWNIRYTGRRHPLLIHRPSISSGWSGTTEARLYAFPPGEARGRIVIFTAPTQPGLFSQLVLKGSPEDWFLEVPKGETATGAEVVSVADLKKRLRTLYPAEFSADMPPKLYAEFLHNAWDRGYLLVGIDAWTGELGRQTYIEVPALKTW